jgi:glycosyltransferase involved in cell wall biosynthesis
MNNHESIRVSIIIPTYNSARYLPQALESVFSQNYTAYELIVVDDGSTDDTAVILQPYRDHITLIQQENTGSAAARNRGLALAHGEYVLFLDADDLLLPGKLTAQVAFLDEQPDLGSVHSGWRLINEQGQAIKDIEPWHNAPHLDLITWLIWKPVKLGAMLFRRHWLEKVNGLDPALRQSHDVDLMLRLALAGCQMAWMKRPTLCYRYYPHSTMRRGALEQAKFAIRVLDKFFALPNVPLTVRRHERQCRYYSHLWVAWHLYQTGHPAETVTALHKTLAYTSQALRYTVLDWFIHFERWAQAEGHPSLAELPSFLVNALPDDVTVPSGLARLLEWQRTVWQHYQQEAWTQARRGLQLFNHLTIAQLITLAQQSIVANHTTVTNKLLDQFWHDLADLHSANLPGQHEVIPLYLTLAGQLGLSGRWHMALTTLWRAGRYSVTPKAWSAWGRFFYTALTYSIGVIR